MMYKRRKKKATRPSDAEIERVIEEILNFDSVKQLREYNIEVRQHREDEKYSITFQDANRIYIAEKLRNSDLIKRLSRHCEIKIKEFGRGAFIHIRYFDFVIPCTKDGTVDAEECVKFIVWAKEITEQRERNKKFWESVK